MMEVVFFFEGVFLFQPSGAGVMRSSVGGVRSHKQVSLTGSHDFPRGDNVISPVPLMEAHDGGTAGG